MMKRVLLQSPAFLLTFAVGLIASGLIIHESTPPIIRERPKSFEIHLEPINVRDTDQSRWNMNGGYLALYDAVFINEHEVLSVYLQDGFRRSTDGGKTWTRMFEPSGIPTEAGGFGIQSLEFLDSKIGWASGSSLLATNDGGQSWRKLVLPEWMDNMKVKFLTEKIGYVAGRAGFCNRDRTKCNTSLTVYKTLDGGVNWKKSFRTRDIETPWQIEIVDHETVMLTGGGGWLWRTANGGRSWKAIFNRDFGRVMSISRTPDGRYWLFGKNSIRVSENSGLTWNDAGLGENLTNQEWSSVDFDRSGIGIAVSEEGAIALTRDGGKSWKRVDSNLHFAGKVPVQNNPFNEQLRDVKIRGNHGIFNGSQRDYLLTIAEASN